MFDGQRWLFLRLRGRPRPVSASVRAHHRNLQMEGLLHPRDHLFRVSLGHALRAG